MWIDVRIPYELNNQLALAYNRALSQSTAEWVLFLDHDVYLCNPKWYEMCLAAIGALREDDKAVCVTCRCGGETHPNSSDKSDSIEHHIDIARERYSKYGNKLTKMNEYAAGYFLLMKRKVAMSIGFHQMNNSINNIDADFGTRLLWNGYHIYMMEGLYIYHRRRMKHVRKLFSIYD